MTKTIASLENDILDTLKENTELKVENQESNITEEQAKTQKEIENEFFS